jgi:hypothetical protein
MNARAAFGLSILTSLLSSTVAAMLFAWPWLRSIGPDQALTWLVAPHLFLRFLGISFVVPGVVSGALPRTWSVPAAYGDLIAGALAIVAIVVTAAIPAWANVAVWIFNIWGTEDLLFAFFQGARVRLDPGSLGAAFYVVTAIVPPLLVTHVLIFALLLRSAH